MFNWISSLIKGKGNHSSRYVTCTNTSNVSCQPVMTCSPPVTPSNPAPSPPRNIYKVSCSTIQNCNTSNLRNGYKESPYSKNFKKPEKFNHEYKPIETNFCNVNTCCVSPGVPVIAELPTPKEAECKNIEVPQTSQPNETQIDFYETVKVVSGCKNNTPNPINCSPSPETNTIVENPAVVANIVKPEEGQIFVMNGYGMNVDVDGQQIVGYLDTGKDMNFLQGEKVDLYQYGGIYNKKIGTVLSATDTERKGLENEILVQGKTVNQGDARS